MDVLHTLRRRAPLWSAPALIATIAWLVVVVALDPAGDYPKRWAGPGLTVDERFNVLEGYRIADRLLEGDFAGYRKAIDVLPDHPPLGRVWIGLFQEMACVLSPPADNKSPCVVACARTAPAAAFAILVFLVGYCASCWYGPLAGIVAAISLVLMPRVFGHAHLASLETFITLTYFAAVAGAAAYWTGESPPTARQAVGTGFLFGLALLTKIQAVLLPPPIAVWALLVWRRRALLPLSLWGATGMLVFFGGWTWLWSDPVGHLGEYLGGAVQRAVLYVWYFGHKIADRDVPWHYPWVLFLTTVPVGLQLLGVCGICAGERPIWRSPRESLLAACLVFPLIVFSLQRVAVYDGERLFLVVFPLWGIFIGRGAASAFEWLGRRMSHRNAALLLVCGLTFQAYGIIALQPCYLSYYNVLVGGLRGAEAMGLQSTYWGDSLTRDLLRKTAHMLSPGTIVDVRPVLEPLQVQALWDQCPPLRAKGIVLRPFTGIDHPAPRYVLVFFRKQDLPDDWRNGPPGAKALVEVRREAVLLAALYDLHPQ